MKGSIFLRLTAGFFAIAASWVGGPPPNQYVTASPISKEERQWIDEEVAPLVTKEEKKIYLSLAAPYQRTAFREEFWRIREKEGLKPPFGPGFKARYEQRLELANQVYGGW